MKETEWQSRIVKSIKNAGGMAHKMPSGIILGYPDLIFSLTPFGGSIMEVKLIKELPLDFKHRKVETTTLQKNNLLRWRENHGSSFLVMVVEWAGGKKKIVTASSIPIDAEQVTYEDLEHGTAWVNNDFDINHLLKDGQK